MRKNCVTTLVEAACDVQRRSYLQLFAVRQISKTHSRRWNNVTATKRLKRLYSDHDDTIQSTHGLRIVEAFTIYNNISEPINHYVIHTMLKLCISLQCPDKILSLWDDIKDKDGVSLLLVMKCCISCGNIEKGIETLDWMNRIQFRWRNEFELKEYRWCISELLSLCSSNDPTSVEKVYSLIQHEEDIFIKTALINAFGKCLNVTKALEIFHSVPMSQLDTVALNSMIRICTQNGMNSHVLTLYDQYPKLCTVNTDILAIDACIQSDDFQAGKRIIDSIASNTPFPKTRVLRAMMEFYGHFGAIKEAEDLFLQQTESPNFIKSVCLMMKLYVDHEHYHNALDLYDSHSDAANDLMHNLAIKSCIKLGDYNRGRDIYVELDPFQSIGRDQDRSIELKNTVIDFYCHFGDLQKAECIFREIERSQKTISTINIMMAGYCNHPNKSYSESTLRIFMDLDSSEESHLTHLTPTVLTYALALKACTQGTALHFGMEIHRRLRINEERKWMLMETDVAVNLINLYGKGGMVETAERIFEDIRSASGAIDNIRIWNAMIAAYGRNGKLEEAMDLFHSLQSMDGLNADIATMVNILSACNHAGDAERALDIWECCIVDEEIKFNRNVVTTMVNGLAKKGMLEEARRILLDYDGTKERIDEQDRAMWMALLSGCRKSGDETLHDEICNDMRQRFQFEI